MRFSILFREKIASDRPLPVIGGSFRSRLGRRKLSFCKTRLICDTKFYFVLTSQAKRGFDLLLAFDYSEPCSFDFLLPPNAVIPSVARSRMSLDACGRRPLRAP
jgi:hypothetical protein